MGKMLESKKKQRTPQGLEKGLIMKRRRFQVKDLPMRGKKRKKDGEKAGQK